jgi:phage tail-like protein
MALYEVLTACRFYIEFSLDGSPDPIDAIFMECSGFKRAQEVIEACEVTPQQWGEGAKSGRVVRTKIPGNVTSNNLTLKRGLTCSTSLWNWFDEVQSGRWSQQRRNGSITIYDQSSQPQARFQMVRAWPTRYTVGNLTASSNDIELEEVEIVCEEFYRDSDVSELKPGATLWAQLLSRLKSRAQRAKARVENIRERVDARRDR